MEIPKELRSLTKTLQGQSWATDSLLVETQEGRFVSAYNPGTLSDGAALAAGNMVRHAFPALTTQFISLLIAEMRELNFSDERATDAVKNVIRNCEYPQPTIARFISYDKRKRVFTYNEMLLFLSQNQGFTTNHFEIVEAGPKKMWALK